MNIKKLIIVVLTVVAISLVAWLLSHRKLNYTNLPPRSGSVWVAFGDSLTAGTGADEKQDYPTQLANRLGVKILNRGVPSETTAQGLARVDEILALNPKVVLLCLGGNDGLQGVPIANTMSNLSQIIERLQSHGAFVVVIGVRSASLLDQYDKQFKKVARQHNTLYIPNILKGVLGDRGLMSDQIHPNNAGYEKIAERIAKILRPLLPQLQLPTQ